MTARRLHGGAPLLALLIAAVALSVAAHGNGHLPGDVAIQRFVQRADGDLADQIARLGNVVGSSRFHVVLLLPVAAGLFVAGARGAILYWFAAAALRPLNGQLKRIVDSPRPTAADVRVSEHLASLGFPSGHAMGTTLMVGGLLLAARPMLATARARTLAVGVAIVVMLWVGFARVYVGAHWPSDVVGGYLWGGVLLLALREVGERIARRVGLR